MADEMKCDGKDCSESLSDKAETYPEGACAMMIHVKSGEVYLEMKARLCSKCTTKLMGLFKQPEANA